MASCILVITRLTDMTQAKRFRMLPTLGIMYFINVKLRTFKIVMCKTHESSTLTRKHISANSNPKP